MFQHQHGHWGRDGSACYGPSYAPGVLPTQQPWGDWQDVQWLQVNATFLPQSSLPPWTLEQPHREKRTCPIGGVAQGPHYLCHYSCHPWGRAPSLLEMRRLCSGKRRPRTVASIAGWGADTRQGTEGNVWASHSWPSPPCPQPRVHSPVLADTDQYSACISLARCTASTSTCSHAAPDWEKQPSWPSCPAFPGRWLPLPTVPPPSPCRPGLGSLGVGECLPGMGPQWSWASLRARCSSLMGQARQLQCP